MKIYISIDMEGMPGTFNWEHEKVDRTSVRAYCMAHVTDCLTAILESDKSAELTEICIADSHSAGDNLYYGITALDDRISLISGGPRPQYMMPAFSSEYSMVFLLGYHAGTGALKANMDHTYSNSRIQKIWINGIPMNEAMINSAYAGYFGVPVALASGDKALEDEMRTAMPWVSFVRTKEAVGKFAAKNYSQTAVQKSLKLAVTKALNSSKLPVYRFDSPVTLKIEFKSTAMTDVACLMPYVQRLDGRTVEYTDNDYAVVFEAIMALVTLASTAGM